MKKVSFIVLKRSLFMTLFKKIDLFYMYEMCRKFVVNM